MNHRFGIITSHMSDHFLRERERVEVATPWGAATLYHGLLEGVPTAVLLRYGEQATTASHRINYRANLWAMKALGVEFIVSQNAIGSVNPAIAPGAYVVPHDFMDFTKNRVLSLFQDEDCWTRMDMTEPFCPQMRARIIDAAKRCGVTPREQGIFICTEGPRFETAAEVRFYRDAGGDIIGTPMVPEVILAREACICYASLSMVINFATGLAPAVNHSGEDGIITFYRRTGMEETVERILRAVATSLPAERDCDCRSALERGLHGQLPEWCGQW